MECALEEKMEILSAKRDTRINKKMGGKKREQTRNMNGRNLPKRS